MNGILAFMEGTTIGFDDIKSIIDPVIQQFSVANIAAVIGGVLGVSVGFVFMWWGVRKLYRMVLKATTKGKGGV